MILPGLISLPLYKRTPTTLELVLGLMSTLGLSAMLGYLSPGGPLGLIDSEIVALIGGATLYAGPGSATVNPRDNRLHPPRSDGARAGGVRWGA